MNPQVSVIIPVYNGETFLRECLESVLSQCGCAFEVICVNDGSKDSSGDILADFASKDARIKIITQKNQGVSAARNNAMLQAQGEYIIFMDCDDLYPAPDVLALLYKTASDNQAEVCAGSFSEFYPDGHKVLSFTGKQQYYTFHKGIRVSFAEFPFTYGFHRFMYQREFLLKHKLEFPPIGMHEDPVFLVRVLIAAKQFYAIPEIVYAYRQRDKQYTFTPRKVTEQCIGGLTILKLLRDTEYQQLYNQYRNDFFGDFSEGDRNAAGNLCIEQMLNGDTALAKLLFSGTDEKLLPPLAKLLGKDDPAGISEAWFDSSAWKNALLKFRIKNQCRKLCQCFHENGILYTLRILLGKLCAPYHMIKLPRRGKYE